jgi:hypothetical protein
MISKISITDERYVQVMLIVSVLKLTKKLRRLSFPQSRMLSGGRESFLEAIGRIPAKPE